MKKFKPNILSRIILQAIEVFIPFSIGGPIMIVLMEKEDITVFFDIFLSVLPVFIILLVILNTINLITHIYNKHYVFLYDDHFVHNDTPVSYCDVTKIEIDSGKCNRTFKDYPCQLHFWNETSRLTSIERPPFILIILLLLRCKNATKRYTNYKRFIFVSAFILAFCVVFALGI